MNTIFTRTAFAAVLIAASTASFADGATYDGWNALQTTTSRAAVQADAATAQRNGEIVAGEIGSVEHAFKSTTTRVQVAAESREAQRLGLIGGGEVTPVASASQERAVQLAGQRAVASRLAIAAR